ncbi:lipid asymmetry maintenance ABC transporter permease subunit MlaE [Psychromonas antarctica]|uniref:lipid asymmetry maintenance ABC transporter permease subunit MlaE n=1 Tax=Psychromonas antarctica TaxID=67573 RepID=UPI001EE98095|nr:lipid asymmetry maintenance ABC transporter permease subunit MlaE [Psychromonas antarctica]MCG6199731.1 lipid asymmetry maintenance ABC transporter permease subunit MlaE [Psychromonas antarctica]
MISAYVRSVGQFNLRLLAIIGRCCLMLWRTIWGKPHAKLLSLIAEQIFQLGILSLPIILTAGLFIGMVLSLQGYYVLVDYAAEDSLGSMVALSLLRELGPVVAALLFAGRAGSALTAEIGLMQSTEQLAGMEMMAVSPYKRVIAPRLFAGIITLPMLTLLFNVIAIWGGYIIGVTWKGVDGGAYWSVMQGSVEYLPDVFNGVIKSVVFAILITWIALYNGYYVVPNAQGISQSTTQTVVVSSLLVLAMDFVLTVLMFGG